MVGSSSSSSSVCSLGFFVRGTTGLKKNQESLEKSGGIEETEGSEEEVGDGKQSCSCAAV